MDLKSFKKGFSEKYEFVFKDGDYAIFNISSDNIRKGTLQISSSFGACSHTWNSIGGNFKEFLCNIGSDLYLLDKLSERKYFYFDDYIDKCKGKVLTDRKSREITKEQAREVYDYFKNNMDNFEYPDSFDMVWLGLEADNSKLLNEIFNPLEDSGYMPELDYSKDIEFILDEMYPFFIGELKKEIKNSYRG